MAMDLVDKIIAFECGELDDMDVIRLCAEMTKRGNAIAVSGMRKLAAGLIEKGVMSKDGDIDYERIEELTGD